MSDLSEWQKVNDQYLTKALAWLRLRLVRFASHTEMALPQTSGGVTDSQVTHATAEMIEELAAEMLAMENQSPRPALITLSRRFALSRFEQELLLLCACMELDTRISSYCAQAQSNPERRYPTIALALALFNEPAWDVLSPQRALRYWRLIEINQPGAQPLTTSALRADERIVSYIKGLNYLDDRLVPLIEPLEMPDQELTELPPSQRLAVETAVRRLRQTGSLERLPIIQLLGPDSSSKRLVAHHIAAALGLQPYRLAIGALPLHATELENLARLWQRESMLLPIALYLDAQDSEAAPLASGQAPPISNFLSRISGVIFLDTRETQRGAGELVKQNSLLLDIAKPTPSEQRIAWCSTLEKVAGDGKTFNPASSSAVLASQFNLNLATIQLLARSAVAEIPANATNGERKLHNRLWDACLANTRPLLDTLAQRLDPKATWDDIVLAEEAVILLRQISAQVNQRNKVYEEWGFYDKMNRGLGITALFAGESGTGKTMAAEVIANELRLNLYRIDLSAVVSKYIGETEKNLCRLFDAAEDGGAILFFDEADALFGKRSEVKDSHDRFANIEINYLLQRMEAYRGLAILATNMKSALDPAFMRRLRFIVSFTFPDQEEREAVWRKVFPAKTPTAALDFERLGRLNVTGGSIHNMALNAAFLAAQAGTPVTMPLILEAARIEFRKLGRPINDSDFRMIEAVK
jgi:ATPase family protein associated with various cellular activities (AAA)/winged helix domain-containing protein